MIKFFLGNRIIALFFLPIIILLFHILNYQFQFYETGTEINYGFWHGLINFPELFNQLLAGVFVLFNASYLNYLYNNYNFQEKNTYIISLIYVVLISFYYSFYRLDGILISHTFFILGLTQLFKLKQNQDGKEAIFNSAVFLGCASTFDPSLILFFPVYIVMYLIIRPFILQELILFITGFISPILVGITYLKWAGKKLTSKLLIDNNGIEPNKDLLLILIFISIFLILSFIGIRNRITKSSNRIKKQIQIIWIVLFLSICLGSIHLLYFKQIEHISLTTIPLAILLSYSFLNKRYSILTTFLFYLTIGYAVIKFFIMTN
jgi:hypothetical protein